MTRYRIQTNVEVVVEASDPADALIAAIAHLKSVPAPITVDWGWMDVTQKDEAAR